ncbi:MAG: AlwI family type II restriction endonuclease [Bacteroidales bacterium]|nr:AlwI family type II restriction endonuclease [Bacteroidales bacterium]
MANPSYKPLLFTTTMRNPQRIKAMLWVLKKFDEKILDDALATEIVGETIRYGLYRPMKKSESIKAKWLNAPMGEFGNEVLSDSEVKYMIDNNPQQHKEAGFERGYPSRFATIFDFAKELGFVYFTPGEPIIFSSIGNKLASVFEVNVNDEGAISVEDLHPEYEQQAFLHAMCKSQRANPFVKVLNDNVPLILLLQVLKKINSDPRWNGKGVTRKELPLFIFWKNNDADALYKRICELREEYRYNPSDEVIIDICRNEIMEGKMKKFDPSSVITEYPDEYIRKMRITGLISLRGAGRFIDLNHNEDDRINYVLERYSTYPKFSNERDYFNYMANVDENLFAIESIRMSASQSEDLLKAWVNEINWQTIKKELEILAKRSRTSDHQVLKFIPAPARLEFLSALAIKSKLPNVRVIPNYSCDDTGLPTSTAGGGIGDIECFENTNGILVEVTMAEGRQQTMMEIWPIYRHLKEFKDKYTPESQCLFIAPSIFSDSQMQINYVRDTEGYVIRPYKIPDFIEFLETSATLYSA